MSFNPKNTLQQDLFLVAKGHYVQQLALHRSEIARQVCATHILHAIDRMDMHSTLYWVTREFVDSGLILNDPKQFTRFLVDLGHGPMASLGLPDKVRVSSDPRAHYLFWAIESLLAQVRYLQVVSSKVDGEWVMPFERPEVDPALEQLLLNYNRDAEVSHV